MRGFASRDRCSLSCTHHSYQTFKLKINHCSCAVVKLFTYLLPSLSPFQSIYHSLDATFSYTITCGYSMGDLLMQPYYNRLVNSQSMSDALKGTVLAVENHWILFFRRPNVKCISRILFFLLSCFLRAQSTQFPSGY